MQAAQTPLVISMLVKSSSHRSTLCASDLRFSSNICEEFTLLSSPTVCGLTTTSSECRSSFIFSQIFRLSPNIILQSTALLTCHWGRVFYLPLKCKKGVSSVSAFQHSELELLEIFSTTSGLHNKGFCIINERQIRNPLQRLSESALQ